MPANIMDNNKIFLYKTSAWHKLVEPSDDQIMAVEAGKRIGLPVVCEQDLFTDNQQSDLDNPSIYNITDHKAIMAYVDDGRIFNYAVVSKKYKLLSHEKFLEIFEDAVSTHVETCGLLGNGERLFVTVELPGFDIGGEEQRSFLFASNTIDGLHGVHIRDTYIRVVCENTWRFAMGSHANDSASMAHFGDVEIELRDWLFNYWITKVENQAVIKDTAEMLRTIPATDKRVEFVLANVYPKPEQPCEYDPDNPETLTQLGNWEATCKRQQKHRDYVTGLFNGNDPTMTPALEGNMWGIAQEVSFYESHCRKNSNDVKTYFGSARERIDKAFQCALDSRSVV